MLSKLGLTAILTLSLAAAACSEPTKMTGGGRIDALPFYDTTKASFGFNGNSCDGDVKGHFNFVDNTYAGGDVRLGADVTTADYCLFFGCGYCFEGEVVIDATYESHVNGNRGTGTLQACLRDGGEGQDAEDNVFMAVLSGPFTGYAIEGPIRGNTQEHGCKE